MCDQPVVSNIFQAKLEVYWKLVCFTTEVT